MGGGREAMIPTFRKTKNAFLEIIQFRFSGF